MSIQQGMRLTTQNFVTSTLILAVLILAVLLVRSLGIGGSDRTAPVSTVPADPSVEWVHVYFTAPGEPNAKSLRGGPDADLAAAIDAARLSVDVAVYELNLWSVRDALIAAHRRGVAVRLVTDSDNIDSEEIQDLKDVGIQVLGDRRESLMHNKFVIIDGQEIWSGSMNFTINDAYKNNNNLIRIRSAELAQDYTNEFEEMFIRDQFGQGSPANTPYPSLVVEGTPLEIYFSPDDGASAHLVEHIQEARRSIHFLAYSFTSDAIAEAILERAQSGVAVSGVFEASQAETNFGGEYQRLHDAGIDVRLDSNVYNMHHKVIIIDGQVVVTGSYNFSANAEERNDENLLVIDNPVLAGQYEAEFAQIFSQAEQ
jgi:phosphatidylserine/phosphatidylglycerophosphate/cardiolipin synthase-like enzyme